LIFNKIIKFLIIINLLIPNLFFIQHLFKSKNDHNEKSNIININLNKQNNCNKWIVITTFNPPTTFIINLEKIIKDWKIVVIGINKINDNKWDIFNSSIKLL
jgi:hypothetical protein